MNTLIHISAIIGDLALLGFCIFVLKQLKLSEKFVGVVVLLLLCCSAIFQILHLGFLGKESIEVLFIVFIAYLISKINFKKIIRKVKLNE